MGTTNYSFVYMEANQAAPHITFNTALDAIDAAILAGGGGGGSTSALPMTDYDITGHGTAATLTAGQTLNPYINFWASGAVGAMFTATVPSTRGAWIVDNYTGVDVALKTAGGTPITIETGRTALVWCDSGDMHAQANFLSESMQYGWGVNMSFNTSTGTKFGTGVTEKMGFWGKTAIIQPKGATQAALTDSTTGTSSTTVNNVTAAFSQTILNNNFASILVLLNKLRTDLVSAGLIKGAA